ncbi:hypothetical protein PIROE2DRAFT_19132 [Piromyces sp. E2]|nr:hypothetical protein PIROE2DRAFT_19132 [Piromyces sp. E2]|eukprot:OUM56311.1 hypothetical protein PIROE2DRAFT_19132 [Piromyces sp. E2]
MLTPEQLSLLESERKYFVEYDRSEATYFQWLFSKGTNYSCYIEYLNSTTEEFNINKTIDIKPVLKIVLIHYVLRCTGNVMDKFGELKSNYYSNEKVIVDGNETIVCNYYSKQPYQHPLRWFVTRYIGTILWYVGEMAVDWYPLLRTRAVARNDKSIKYVYLTCGIFNFSKVLLILYHFTLSPTEIYDKDGVYNENRIQQFYFYYWMIQLTIICTSFIYELTVFLVLKKKFFNKTEANFGFLKKFRTISEYRIFFTAAISVTFLPAISISIFLNCFYYMKGFRKLDTTFEDIRKLIANVEYYMIFIDQILLLYSQKKHTTGFTSSDSEGGKNEHSNPLLKPITSHSYLETLNKINSNDTLTNNSEYYDTNSVFNTLKSNYSNYSNYK